MKPKMPSNLRIYEDGRIESVDFPEAYVPKFYIKKWVYCLWKHYGYRCYPEVWGRGLKGLWHCEKCHPCNEDLIEFLSEQTKLKKVNV